MCIRDRYKSEDEPDAEIVNELRSCAGKIHDTDVRMQRIYEKISESQTIEEKFCIDKGSDNDIISLFNDAF